jgi:PAS domain containing serine/threonine kinase
VVTKYIDKVKITNDIMIHERYGQIPLEISIICKLDHPNIIKVLEVFQDDDYIKIVMAKHGISLKTFVENKRLNEEFAREIFRQLVCAVSYLHSNNIVHRDINDENIVIDEELRIKLIDFGSAAYMQEGKTFAKFYGTLDYCSPEVLLGNKYNGLNKLKKNNFFFIKILLLIAYLNTSDTKLNLKQFDNIYRCYLYLYYLVFVLFVVILN